MYTHTQTCIFMERVWKDILQVVLSELGRDHELAQVSKGNEEL